MFFDFPAVVDRVLHGALLVVETTETRRHPMEQSFHKYSHISIIERAKIDVFLEQGMGVSAIARALNRAKSSIFDRSNADDIMENTKLI